MSVSGGIPTFKKVEMSQDQKKGHFQPEFSTIIENFYDMSSLQPSPVDRNAEQAKAELDVLYRATFNKISLVN